jgi:diguanylate cyclase (GGDEF)-like protein
MNKKSKYNVDTKIFLVPLIIFTFVFLGIGYHIKSSINNHYLNHVKVESKNLAESYSHSLSLSAEALEVGNELLEKRLLVAGRTITLYKDRYSNDLLDELAGSLEVDEINICSPQGEIVFSNMRESIGSKLYPGHPAYDFMNSNKISYVEEIRPSEQSGVLYKYGYFKAPDGSIVQIGVMATKIQKLLGKFEMQQSLQSLKDRGNVTQINFINNDLSIIGSTNDQFIGQKITNQKVKNAIAKGKIYSYTTDNEEEKEYKIFVPIYSNENKIGTLAFSQSLKETQATARQVTTMGLMTLIFIYALLIYMMFSVNKKNKQLIQMAFYDSLTGLPNIQYLKELLNKEIKKKSAQKRALLVINCSNFRIVNLTYGYEFGDELLKIMSEKLKELVGDREKLFRFTEEKFVLLINNYDSQEDLISLTTKISQMFNLPFQVNGTEQNLVAKIGIVEIDRHYDNVDRILKDASISLSQIKMHDLVNYAFFNEMMEDRLQREGLIEHELRTAIMEKDTKQLYLEFQPLLDLRTNNVTCFEALARMRTNSLDFVTPPEFIEVAEKNQLIIPLSNFIIKKACNFIRTLNAEGFRDIKVAVNISGIHLLRDDFIDTVLDIIDKSGIEKSSLELEITESVLLDNYDVINQKLKKLKENEIGIALDDFGTGYSSFSRLGELSIDTVKIDKYFIDSISNKDHKLIIAGDIISMAHKLGHKVVAEGVELQSQKEYLLEKGCDFIQGYLFSKPLSEMDSIELLKNINRVEK